MVIFGKFLKHNIIVACIELFNVQMYYLFIMVMVIGITKKHFILKYILTKNYNIICYSWHRFKIISKIKNLEIILPQW
jgi:hypothetical protein